MRDLGKTGKGATKTRAGAMDIRAKRGVWIMSLPSAITLVECRMSQETAIEALVLRGNAARGSNRDKDKELGRKKGEGKEREL
jgi:hypothetical protein